MVGWPFTVPKLRTMREQSKDGQTLWTQPGDQRITGVGSGCRLRLDELPQLLNVLNGEIVSSVLVRRPELEHDLERR